MAQPALIEDPNDPGTFLIQSFSLEDTSTGPGYPPSNGGGLQATTLQWGAVGQRYFELGVDRGVLYLEDGRGVAWNGLLSVEEAPSGGEIVPYYLDGMRYMNLTTPEEYEGTLEAYTYPKEFGVYDGTSQVANGLYITQQSRKSFGLSYRTGIGNDINGVEHGYKIHIIFNAMASPSQKTYESHSDSLEPMTFSWGFATHPVKFQGPAFGIKYGAHLVIDSRTTYPEAMAAIERILYGTDGVPARLPSPDEFVNIFAMNALLRITDNGDGTWTATGPDEAIKMLSEDQFEITWDSVQPIDEDSYRISSL